MWRLSSAGLLRLRYRGQGAKRNMPTGEIWDNIKFPTLFYVDNQSRWTILIKWMYRWCLPPSVTTLAALISNKFIHCSKQPDKTWTSYGWINLRNVVWPVWWQVTAALLHVSFWESPATSGAGHTGGSQDIPAKEFVTLATCCNLCPGLGLVNISSSLSLICPVECRQACVGRGKSILGFPVMGVSSH